MKFQIAYENAKYVHKKLARRELVPEADIKWLFSTANLMDKVLVLDKLDQQDGVLFLDKLKMLSANETKVVQGLLLSTNKAGLMSNNNNCV
jgi:hypothetical protein